MIRAVLAGCLVVVAGCGDDASPCRCDAAIEAGPMDGGEGDAGRETDAGWPDAEAADAAETDTGPDDGGEADSAGADGGPDATPPDAGDPGACNPDAVDFPMGGSLSPGTLCDEVYACAADEADVARIEAASARFDCTPGPEPASGCGAFTCSYRDPGGPSTLDEAEIAEICKVTVLSPPPPMRCVVFL